MFAAVAAVICWCGSGSTTGPSHGALTPMQEAGLRYVADGNPIWLTVAKKIRAHEIKGFGDLKSYRDWATRQASHVEFKTENEKFYQLAGAKWDAEKSKWVSDKWDDELVAKAAEAVAEDCK